MEKRAQIYGKSLAEIQLDRQFNAAARMADSILSKFEEPSADNRLDLGLDSRLNRSRSPEDRLNDSLQGRSNQLYFNRSPPRAQDSHSHSHQTRTFGLVSTIRDLGGRDNRGNSGRRDKKGNLRGQNKKGKQGGRDLKGNPDGRNKAGNSSGREVKGNSGARDEKRNPSDIHDRVKLKRDRKVSQKQNPVKKPEKVSKKTLQKERNRKDVYPHGTPWKVILIRLKRFQIILRFQDPRWVTRETSTCWKATKKQICEDHSDSARQNTDA